MRYVHDDGGGPWWQSRSASVVAAVLLVLAVVAVVGVVLTSGSDPRQAVATDLANARAAVEDAMAPVGRATRLQQIRDAGRQARVQIDRLSGPAANLANMDDAKLAEPAATLIAREREYLEALAGLEGVTQSVVEDPELKRWRSIKNRLVDSHRTLGSAGAAITSLRLPEDGDAVAVPTSRLETTLNRVDAAVTGANRQLVEYARKLRSFREAQARARQRAGVIGQYRSRVAAILDQYSSERRVVSLWAQSSAPRYSRDETDEAQTKLRGFYRDRLSTIRRLESALSSAPDGVKSYHRDLGEPLADSLAGLSKVDDAITSFSFSSEYDDMTQTPAWAGFLDDSAAAEENLGSIRGLWANAVAQEIKRASFKGVPPKPKKPRI